MLAHLALPLILFLFYLTVRNEEFRWIYLLLAALLLLNLRSHSVVLWSQPAFACLFSLHQVTVTKFALAAVWCSLASFTYASGQVVWLLGLVSLLHQRLVTRRISFSYPLLWLMVAVAMLSVWRLGFVDYSYEIPSAQDLAFWPDQLIDPPPRIVQALARYASWLLVIVGYAFIDSSTVGAGAVGFVVLALLSYITIRDYKSRGYPVDAVLLVCRSLCSSSSECGQSNAVDAGLCAAAEVQLVLGGVSVYFAHADIGKD